MCVRLPDETEIRSNGKVHNEEKTSEYAKRRDKMTKTKKQHPRRQNLSRCFCNANVWPHLTNCIHFHKTKTREISTNFSRIKKKKLRIWSHQFVLRYGYGYCTIIVVATAAQYAHIFQRKHVCRICFSTSSGHNRTNAITMQTHALHKLSDRIGKFVSKNKFSLCANRE